MMSQNHYHNRDYNSFMVEVADLAAYMHLGRNFDIDRAIDEAAVEMSAYRTALLTVEWPEINNYVDHQLIQELTNIKATYERRKGEVMNFMNNQQQAMYQSQVSGNIPSYHQPPQGGFGPQHGQVPQNNIQSPYQQAYPNNPNQMGMPTNAGFAPRDTHSNASPVRTGPVRGSALTRNNDPRGTIESFDSKPMLGRRVDRSEVDSVFGDGASERYAGNAPVETVEVEAMETHYEPAESSAVREVFIAPGVKVVATPSSESVDKPNCSSITQGGHYYKVGKQAPYIYTSATGKIEECILDEEDMNYEDHEIGFTAEFDPKGKVIWEEDVVPVDLDEKLMVGETEVTGSFVADSLRGALNDCMISLADKNPSALEKNILFNASVCSEFTGADIKDFTAYDIVNNYTGGNISVVKSLVDERIPKRIRNALSHDITKIIKDAIAQLGWGCDTVADLPAVEQKLAEEYGEESLQNLTNYINNRIADTIELTKPKPAITTEGTELESVYSTVLINRVRVVVIGKEYDELGLAYTGSTGGMVMESKLPELHEFLENLYDTAEVGKTYTRTVVLCSDGIAMDVGKNWISGDGFYLTPTVI
jgi:hypothetical protein